MYKIFFDTNVMLDVVNPTREQHLPALNLLRWCNGSGDMGIACSLSFKDLYYIMDRRFSEQIAREAVRKLMGLLVTAPVDAEVCDMAYRSNEPDFEDGLIRAAAELNDADFIVTRDKNAFSMSKIKSMDAASLYELVTREDRGYAGLT